MAGKILVIGATGTVGAPLTAELVAKGESVKAGTHSGKTVPGAESVRFDFSDPSSFGPAFEGVDRVFLLLPTGTLDIYEKLAPVIEFAAARKVKVVMQSVFGVEADDEIPYRRAEILLERSGIPYVILRPNWFSDNFHVFWLEGIRHGAIAVPAGEGKSSFVDARDIAASAAAALTTDRFDGKAFSLTGPAALGYAEAAAIIAGAIGKPVAYQAVDDDAFVGILTGAGVPEAYARFLASIFYPVRQGWTATVTDAVETLTGKAPRSVADYVADNKEKLAS